MKKYIFLILVLILSFSSIGLAENVVYDELVKNVMLKNNLQGTFVLLNNSDKSLRIFNAVRAEQKLPPGSTFKIFNSLIGLETGAVKNTDEVFYKYAGEPVFLKSWQQNASLRSAIRSSQVPAYRLLARKIGQTAMQENIEKLGYGNCLIGTPDSFWLDNSLQISALEQAYLLDRLVDLKLPYAVENQRAVQEICLLEKFPKSKLFGKTGWATDNIKYPVGWFVGWTESENGKYIFAFNADISCSEDLYKREDCVKEILSKLDIIKDEV